MWGIWSIHPDGTNWNPVISAFENGGAPSAYHFQTQLSDGTIIIEKYYNQNQKGFGTLFKLPETPPAGVSPRSAPAIANDPRNQVKFIDVDGKRASPRGAVLARRHGADHALDRLGGPARRYPHDPERRELAADRQGDASLRRAGQPPARRLDAGPDRRLRRRGAAITWTPKPIDSGLYLIQATARPPASRATCC